MTLITTDSQHYTDIASAIRTQLGVQTTYLPSEMAAAVASISGGGGSLILAGNSYPTSSLGNDGAVYMRYAQSPTLPDGGHFVEHLQSSGTQYINTGISSNYLTDISAKVGYLGDHWILGATDNPSNLSLATFNLIVSGGGNNTAFAYKKTSGTQVQVFVPSPTVGTAYDFGFETHTANNGAFTIVSAASASDVGEFSDAGNFNQILFGVNSNGTVVTDTAKIYRVSYSQNGIPIADYLPAIDGNGVACMWENIAQEYVYNAGTGDFTYGNTITISEPDKIFAVYLKVNGSWQPLIGSDIDDVDTGGNQ